MLRTAEVYNYVHNETLIGAVAISFAWQPLESWRHGENESDYFVCSFLQIIIIFRGPPLQGPEVMATTYPSTYVAKMLIAFVFLFQILNGPIPDGVFGIDRRSHTLCIYTL